MNSTNKTLKQINIFALLALSIIISSAWLNISEINAQEKTICAESLREAEAFYNSGNYQESIRLINECLAKRNISTNERGEAFRIMALVDLAINQDKGAKDAVKNLILMIPNYKYDPDKDPSKLQTMIEDALQQITPSIKNISPNTVEKESDALILTVDGQDFANGSIVQFNNILKTTTYMNQNRLTAEIQAIDLENEGEYEVKVYSPIGAGKTSNGIKFTVTPSSSGFPWTWIAIGGGAVAAAVVAVIALGGNDNGDGEGTLPSPPVRP